MRGKTVFCVDVEKLRDDLLHGDTPDLRRRRGIIGLSAVSLGLLTIGALRQTGVIPVLPDLPLKGVDSNKVALSDEAYCLGAPDASLAAASAAINLPLASIGGRDRTQRMPLVPVAATAKLLVDAAGTLWYWYQMRRREKTWCPYCVISGLANLGALALSVPEALQAVSVLRRGTPSGDNP